VIRAIDKPLSNVSAYRIPQKGQLPVTNTLTPAFHLLACASLMSWTDKLRGVLGGEESERRRVNAFLLGLYENFLIRDAELAAHANQAPTRSAEAGLRSIMDTHRKTATLLGQALAERGVTTPSAPPAATSPIGVNHWARIVADLDNSRLARNTTLEMSTRLDAHPEIAALLLRIVEQTEEQIIDLQRQVARADPQALN
jgi:hypothetical protein